METSKLTLTEQEKEDVALIMRQTGMLDANFVLKMYLENGKDVLEATCKLMGIMNAPEKPHRIEDEFTEFREVLKEKYDIYFDMMSKNKSTDESSPHEMKQP